MEEGSGNQAPVTRIRRRLSVEQSEDTHSPGPSTPTKKRGGRLAAKPQLELIAENADSASKRTPKKAQNKELAETAEEKTVTPSRRSTRIKSNTSIILEISQSVDSPRARRAARRASQVGSDNETVVTPARQTRRTRKDSTSSIDKLETTLSSKTTNVTSIIIEEAEISTQKTDTNNSSDKVSLRKSPRLKEKKKEEEKSSNDAAEEMDSISNNTKTADDKSVIVDTEVAIHKQLQEKSSDISLDIIKELDRKPKQKTSISNKSMSALEDANSFKKKRQRTKSLDVVSQTQTRDNFSLSFSDSEKKRKEKNNISKDLKFNENHLASGDSKMINSEKLEINHTSSDNFDKKIELNTSNNIDTRDIPENESNTNKTLSESLTTAPNRLPDSRNQQGNEQNKNSEDDTDSVIDILKKPLSNVLQSTILFEDSDVDMKPKGTIKNLDSEDQCVPVVETRETCENSNNISFTLNKSDKKIKDTDTNLDNSSLLNKPNIGKNNSCEPMDVDITIPSNSFSEALNKSSDSHNQKSEASYCKVDTSLNTSSKKSKRKSSASFSTTQNLEKSDTENKSTLILSQIKDISSLENNVSKSPKYQEVISKSTNYELTNDKVVDKKNLSLDYSTSTPLQQKYLKKMGLQINTSVIESSKTDAQKASKTPDLSIKNKETSTFTEINTSSDEESNTDHESSKTKSLLDNEADVASDDYESGDSQDEEERQYEAENEVLEKGETLSSEDDFSDDSDYAKDSFVVSTDDEDQNLLSGSGDDLSMSDNELTMSAKSKKKYNERKCKEQKKASKEMFDARHKLDTNAKKSDTKKSHKKLRCLDSSDDSEDEIVAHKRKNKIQILNSSNENNSTVNESLIKKKTNKRLLSESDHNESAIKEQEITTVFSNSAIDNDPLSSNFKQEPKTHLKDFNISTVQIKEEIEEVVVKNDNSFNQIIQTSDPLQESLMNDNSSSLSENSEIMSNYDSILNQLNNENGKPKVGKAHDLSLNLINKTKTKKIPIVEELNLTHTKNKSKQDKKTNMKDPVDAPQPFKITQKEEVNDNISESSSDTIDLHLLFSEDSNDDGDKTSNIHKEKGPNNDFIPLKRTPGKMNILNHKDDDETASNEIKFTIDTEGTHQNSDNFHNISLNNSFKNKTKKQKSSNISQIPVTHDDEDSPLEIPYHSSKTDKNRKSMNTSKVEIEDSNQEQYTSSSMQNQHSAKKNKKKVLTESPTDTKQPDTNSSVQNEDSAKKNKKKVLTESPTDIKQTDTNSSIQNEDSAKKNKKKVLSESHTDTKLTDTNSSIQNEDSAKKNKKKVLSESHTDTKLTDTSSSMQSQNSAKKNKKKVLTESPTDTKQPDTNSSMQNEGSAKKNKRKVLTESPTDMKQTDTSSSLQIQGSAKKSKKKVLSESCMDAEPKDADSSAHIQISVKKSKNVLSQSPKDIEQTDADSSMHIQDNAKKSKKKVLSESHEETELPTAVLANSKKRKRKSSANITIGNNITENGKALDVSPTSNISLSAGREKKKRKISETYNDDQCEGNTEHSHEHISQNTIDTDKMKRNKNQKRKRDSNDDNTASKKLIKYSFDKMQVPRLPVSILNELEDKPKKSYLDKKKSTVVSTTAFVVEEAKKRKNKPSNFLEESVCLNDSHDKEKQIRLIKKPKVLPFMPTAITSGSGFTTNFKINVIPQEVQFVAQTNNADNFKNDYLYGKKIKRFGTYEMYRKQRASKLSKF